MSNWPKIYEFPSKSDPSRSPHKARLFEDGVIVCSCPGFTNHNKCWHIDEVRNKPIGCRDPRISHADKHDICEFVAEGFYDRAHGIVAKLFPSITKEESTTLIDEICNETEE